MIYDTCVYTVIIINIMIIKIIIYYLIILYYKYFQISNKKNIYNCIKDIKNDLINDFHNYSSNEINEIIDEIIKIYIKYTCDFEEDYYNNIKIKYDNIDIFIITKRIQIIDYIKNNIILKYKNKIILDNLEFDEIQNMTYIYTNNINNIFKLI